MICKICNSRMREAFRRNVLRQYEVQYWHCGACGFLQTEAPYWLEHAYSSAIVSADTGILERNTYLANVAAATFWRLFRGKGRFLDLAGGYGLLTRLMRDVGFDYHWTDPHATNLFARGFEGKDLDEPYVAVTAFEVLEHVHDPLGFLADALRKYGARTLLISTQTYSGAIPDPDKWWYYTFETGQHVSFYTGTALSLIARKLGLCFHSSGFVHMWTDHRISDWAFRAIARPKVAAFLARVPKSVMKSRIWSDHDALIRS